MPVIAKEVGWGISEKTAKVLADCGVSAIDVAGAGGTSWSQVEMHRAPDEFTRQLAATFVGWGIPTAESIQLVKKALPDMTVFAPSHYAEVSRMLSDALDICTDGPAAIRFSKTMPPAGESTTGSGLSARRVRVGEEICLIGVGKMLGAASAAADRLVEQGHSVTVWDPRVVKPLDPEMLGDAAGHRLVVTIEDGLRDGGIGASIADALSKLAPTGGPAVRVLGVPSVYLAQGKPDVILGRLGLDADGVVDEVLAWVRSSQSV